MPITASSLAGLPPPPQHQPHPNSTLNISASMARLPPCLSTESSPGSITDPTPTKHQPVEGNRGTACKALVQWGTTRQLQQLIYGDWIPTEGGLLCFQKDVGLEVRVPDFCLVHAENLKACYAGREYAGAVDSTPQGQDGAGGVRLQHTLQTKPPHMNTKPLHTKPGTEKGLVTDAHRPPLLPRYSTISSLRKK